MSLARDILSDHIYYNGPTAFTHEAVAMQPDLFAHRAALFYTPTENLPEEFVGSGILDITLSLPTPDYLEYQELRGYSSPQLWVDQLQRQTWKIRWTPIWAAHIIFTRFDIVRLRDDHYVMGTKALLDALKVKTTGRQDGRLLYYFGAIWNDDAASVTVEYIQESVEHPRLAKLRVQVSGYE
jgi:hypothetical protein